MNARVWMLMTALMAAGLTLTGCAKDQVSEVPDAPPPPLDSSASYDAQPVDNYEPIPPAPQAGTTTTTSSSNEVVFDDSSVDTIEVAPASARSHTVAKGDTLWSIATKYYGDGKKWRDIAAANGISDPSKVAVGKKLIIP